jgi:hypothetical protein
MWTSEDHAAWIINLQTGRLASGVSVVLHKSIFTAVLRYNYNGKIMTFTLGSLDRWINLGLDSLNPSSFCDVLDGVAVGQMPMVNSAQKKF